jgi:tol-pal system protein YbgF
MRPTNVLPAVCVVVIALWTGCAPTVGEVGGARTAVLPEIDVVQVKEHADEALRLAQEAKLDARVLNTKFAEVDNRLILLSEDIAAVSAARLEEIENRLSLLVEAFRDLKVQVEALEGRPRAPVRRTSATPPTFSPRSAAELLTSSEYDLYQKALEVFDARNYEKARELLTDQLKAYPEGDYADRATYWIGETYMMRDQFAKAIASFKQVTDYPRSAKLDDASFKIALAHLKMGQADHARKQFRQVVDQHPNSDYAARARKYLTELDK